MGRSSGTYSAPVSSWNPAVVTTTIDEGDWNALLADLEAALTASIASDGQTPTTALIPFASGISADTIAENSGNTGVTVDGVLLKDSAVTTDTINEKTSTAGVTIDGVLLKDSEVTTDVINEKTGATGVTIDSVLLKDGDATVTNINVAADIIHTGDVDNKIAFTTDTQTFQTGGSTRMDITDSGVQLGGAAARITEFSTDGTLAGNSDTAVPTEKAVKTYVDALTPAWAFLKASTASTSASVDFDSTYITSTYDSYVVIFNQVDPATDGAGLNIRVSTSASFNSGASDYAYAASSLVASSATFSNGVDTAESYIRIQGGVGTGSAAGEEASGVVYIHNPTNASFETGIHSECVHQDTSGVPALSTASGSYLTAEANDGIQFRFTTGNIASGNFYLFGIRKV